MSETFAESPHQHSGEPELEYRSVEPSAIGGLILGLLSPLALLSSILWLVPLFGIAANALALRRLRQDPNRVGRSAALVGLGLSVLFGVVPVAQIATEYVVLKDQPRELADQFLDYLRHDEPRKAIMLRSVPDFRKALDNDEAVKLFFRNNQEAKNDLAKFVQLPVARTLLALGERADIRFLATMGAGARGDRAQVSYWYTVTFDDEQGKKKTFLVGLLMERKPTENPELHPWRVQDFMGPINPKKL
jgi:hypothetical protein